MPIIKSAKKRVKVAAKARARNASTKRTMREALKAFSKAVDSGKAADIQTTQRDAVSTIDMAAKYNVIHKNKAARQKAAMSSKAKAAGAKPAKAAAKPAPKKPTVTAKKAAKTPAKKPAVRKTSAKKTTK